MDEAGGWGAALRRRRVALLIASTVPALVLIGLPYSEVSWARVEGISAMWAQFIFVCDVLTATLLIILYLQRAGVRLLLLAAAFAWSGVLMAMTAFATPGVISQAGAFGAEAPGWLWLFRHIGPPVLIGLALMPLSPAFKARVDHGAATLTRTLVFIGSIVVAGPGVLLVILLAAPSLLPMLEDADGRYSAWLMATAIIVNLVVVGVATLGVIVRSGRSGIEAWALVAAVAWLGDMAFAFMYGAEYSLAWYAERILGMAAAAFVVGAILAEVVLVRRHLLAGTRDLETRLGELVEAQRLREHVAAVLGHDMRAPIAGLQGYLEILDDGTADSNDPDFAHHVHQRCLVLVKRLSLLTEDLQTAALAVNGDLEVLPELLDVDFQLSECVAGFPGLDVRVRCEPGLVVWADPLRLQQVLANLVRNAEKHGAEPITIDARSEAGGMVVMRVSDAGPGVQAAFIPQLFERYSQGPDNATGGSGLGLSVARDLVRAHNGTVRYDLTNPAFIVSLPAAPTEIRTPNGRVIPLPRRLSTRVKPSVDPESADPSEVARPRLTRFLK